MDCRETVAIACFSCSSITLIKECPICLLTLLMTRIRLCILKGTMYKGTMYIPHLIPIIILLASGWGNISFNDLSHLMTSKIYAADNEKVGSILLTGKL